MGKGEYDNLYNGINKYQIDKLAAIIGDNFGIANESGEILYSYKDCLDDIETIFIPVGNDESDPFISDDKYSFYRQTTNDNVYYFFKLNNGNDEETKRILMLAVFAFSNKEHLQKKQTYDFFKALLLNDIKDVNLLDLSLYINKTALEYTAILITIDNKNFIYANDINLVTELLESVFPEQQGYFVVVVEINKIVVVCPINEDKSYNDLLNNAALISDTMLSEIMINVQVSIGQPVKDITKLNLSYKQAEDASNIGFIFEIPQKCFVYDKLGLEKLVYNMNIDSCFNFIKEVLGNDFLSDKSARELIATLNVYFKNNQNVSEAARALYIHRNTMIYRLDKFNKLTGLDCTKFDDGMKIATALITFKYIEKIKPNYLEEI